MVRLVYAFHRQNRDISPLRLARICDRYLWSERRLACQATAYQLGYTLKRKYELSRHFYYKAPRIKIGKITYALIKS